MLKKGEGYFVNPDNIRFFVGTPNYDIIDTYVDVPQSVEGMSVSMVKALYSRYIDKAIQGKKISQNKIKSADIMIKQIERSKKVFSSRIKTYEKMEKMYQFQLAKLKKLK